MKTTSKTTGKTFTQETEINVMESLPLAWLKKHSQDLKSGSFRAQMLAEIKRRNTKKTK